MQVLFVYWQVGKNNRHPSGYPKVLWKQETTADNIPVCHVQSAEYHQTKVPTGTALY